MPVNAVVWSRHPWRFQDHLEDSAPLHGTENWIAMILKKLAAAKKYKWLILGHMLLAICPGFGVRSLQIPA